MIDQHLNGQKLIGELQTILYDLHRYASTVNHYVITSATDLDGTIISASQAFAEISGYSEKELVGQKHDLLKHPDVDPEIYDQLWETISAGDPWQGELMNQKKNGETFWVYHH